MKKIIEVKNLYKLYKLGDSAVRALNGVSLEIYEGEFCAIVGTSGSGKSTMLNMLAGLEKPTKGEVIIDGQHIENLKEDQLVRFRREKVGFIFQSFQLLGSMNALENVALPLSFRGVPKAERLKKADKMLDEPTGNLDSRTSREVMALMQQVVREQKKTLVMVTHDDHLAGYADRIFHIIDGKIVKVEDNRKKAREHAEQGGNEQ